MIRLHEEIKRNTTTIQGVVMSQDKKTIGNIQFEVTGMIGNQKIWSGCPEVKPISILYIKPNIVISAIFVSGVYMQNKHDYIIEKDKIVFLGGYLGNTTVISILGDLD